jgi:hypothetical protein
MTSKKKLPDTDGDGTPDILDPCPNDPFKTFVGKCGCGVKDIDTDGDGIPDCLDACPLDKLKSKPLDCGCGNSEDDCNNVHLSKSEQLHHQPLNTENKNLILWIIDGLWHPHEIIIVALLFVIVILGFFLHTARQRRARLRLGNGFNFRFQQPKLSVGSDDRLDIRVGPPALRNWTGSNSPPRPPPLLDVRRIASGGLGEAPNTLETVETSTTNEDEEEEEDDSGEDISQLNDRTPTPKSHGGSSDYGPWTPGSDVKSPGSATSLGHGGGKYLQRRVVGMKRTTLLFDG